VKVLFPYQKDAKDTIAEALKQRLPAALVVMATGLGKTVVASSFVQWWARRKKSQILFLVHLWEAVGQAEKEFGEMLGSSAKFQFLAGDERLDKNTQVVFSTFQTIRNRYHSMPRHAFGLIVVDECHRSKANTYEPIVEYFRPEFKLAMTATEERMDGRDIRELFGNPVYEYPLAKALANRNLADVEYRVLVDNISQASLRHIEKILGRGKGKVTRAMIDRKVFLAERTNLIAQTIKKEQKTRRKTIIFCNSRRHASAVNKYFPDARTYFTGLPKKVLEERLAAFRAGAISNLIVVNKLNEAVDIPDADLMVFLRMTESKTIWMQQLGRGLRKTKGKGNVLVLDFVANCDRIRIVGQLAGEVRKCLGVSGESAEIHRSGLKFNFESEARNILELLERVENLPQAGTDGTFRTTGEVWGTVSALAKILKVGNGSIGKRIKPHHIPEMTGKDKQGKILKFYPLSKVRESFGKVLKIPRVEGGGILKAEGESWGMAHLLGPMLGLSAPTIEDRGASCRKRHGLVRGHVATFYALSDVRKSCADLLKKMPKADGSGTFKLRREIYGTPQALGRILGISHEIVRRYAPAHLKCVGKTMDGNIRPFYPLSKVRKVCAAHLSKMPEAGKDNTFVRAGQRWGPLNALVSHFGITWRAIKTRVSSCRRVKALDQSGRVLDFYSFTDVKKACADLLKPLPQAGSNGIFKHRGETWGSSYALARMLGVSVPTIKSRGASCRTIEAKAVNGVVGTYYSLTDMRKACKKIQRRKGRK
jgi:superfamily II DNA or RNA helicase